MADLMKIALRRRTELTTELKRIDDFIRMAETLVQSDTSEMAPKSVTAPDIPVSGAEQMAERLERPQMRPTMFRQKAHS